MKTTNASAVHREIEIETREKERERERERESERERASERERERERERVKSRDVQRRLMCEQGRDRLIGKKLNTTQLV